MITKIDDKFYREVEKSEFEVAASQEMERLQSLLIVGQRMIDEGSALITSTQTSIDKLSLDIDVVKDK